MKVECVANKGKDCFVHFGYKYRRYRTKTDGLQCWCCTIKTCKARIETWNSAVVSDIGLHTRDLSVVRIRAATENVMERPAKLIRTAVQEQDDDGEVTVDDVKNCRLLCYLQTT